MAICKLDSITDLERFFVGNPPEASYVICEAGISDLLVEVRYKDKVLVEVNLNATGATRDDVMHYLNLRRVTSKIPNGEITLFGRCRFIAGFRYQVTPVVVFSDFSISTGFVPEYTSRLQLLKSWGFDVPQYVNVKGFHLFKVLTDCIANFDKRRSSGVFIVENDQQVVSPDMAYIEYPKEAKKPKTNGDWYNESFATAGAVSY